MPSGLVMFGLSSGKSSGTRTKVNIRSLVATTLFRHEVLVRHSRLLNDTKLREELLANWDKHVKNAITSTQEVLLDAKLRAYVDSFDFTIFDAKTALAC